MTNKKQGRPKKLACGRHKNTDCVKAKCEWWIPERERCVVPGIWYILWEVLVRLKVGPGNEKLLMEKIDSIVKELEEERNGKKV